MCGLITPLVVLAVPNVRNVPVSDDPVKMFEFKPQPPNSVLKLFHDLYADLTTADLLYTNDAKVLMDIIVGRLSNLSPGDEVCVLSLIHI